MTWLFLSYYGLEGLIAHTDKDTLLLERSAVQALLTSFTCEIYLKLGKKNREIHLIKPFFIIYLKPNKVVAWAEMFNYIHFFYVIY